MCRGKAVYLALSLPGRYHRHGAQGLLVPALLFLQLTVCGIKYAAFVYGGVCVCMPMQCVSRHIQEYTRGEGSQVDAEWFPLSLSLSLLYSEIQSLTEAEAY